MLLSDGDGIAHGLWAVHPSFGGCMCVTSPTASPFNIERLF